MKVLITPKSFSQAGERAYSLLREQGFELAENKTGRTLTEEQMIEACSEVEGVIVGIDPLSEKVLRKARKLKAISKYGAGLDNIDLVTAQELGIKVDRAVGTNAVSVAELAVGLFFTLARNITYSVERTKKGAWERIKGVELTGKTVGIIGMGSIGREVARMVSGLGMKIMAYDPYISHTDTCIAKYSIVISTLEEVFNNSDFLTLHLPLTEETRNMVDSRALGMMKPGSYLINTSRGELVDEDALYDALTGGKLAGAAEDVFSKEPPGEHKLLSLDNFVLTSHIGAYTAEANERMAVQSALNLVNMLKNNK